MKLLKHWMFAAGSIAFLLAGCGDQVEPDANAQTEVVESGLIEAAWQFLEENNWEKTAADNSDYHAVKKTADHGAELLDDSFAGQAVWFVSFDEKESAVAGPPVVLVDEGTMKVVGYVPGE